MTISALAAAMDAEILPLGMTAAASGYVSGPRAAQLAPSHFTNWPAGWAELYVNDNFVLSDPSVRWARASGSAISWTYLGEVMPPRDPGRRVFQAATRYGFTEGMAIPVRSIDDALGLVCFGGKRGKLSPLEQVFLVIIGRATFAHAERVERLGKVAKVPPLLSARELELLVLLVHGHADQQISTMLGISLPTARFHPNNAKTKLGTTSRSHLAALAVIRTATTVAMLDAQIEGEHTKNPASTSLHTGGFRAAAPPRGIGVSSAMRANPFFSK